MKITTVGIELAKNVRKKQLKRDQVAEFFVNLPPCLIGMEACGSAHHWARTLAGFGHTVKLMAPQFVKPYVKTNNRLRCRSPQVRTRTVGTQAPHLP